MIFERPLVSAVFLQRYKRFLFDAVLDGGTLITGSCPNTGSMQGLTEPGSRIWVSLHNSPTRKYRHMLEMVEVNGALVGVNTGLPNRLAEEAIRDGYLPALAGYRRIRREQRYGNNSRIDFLLTEAGLPDLYLEVKNVHFMRYPGLTEFPDTVTKRGAKHLDELAEMVSNGHRAVMLYVIQRQDCGSFRLCEDLDPGYAAAFRRAVERGVEAYAIRCRITTAEIVAADLIKIDGLPQRAYERKYS